MTTDPKNNPPQQRPPATPQRPRPPRRRRDEYPHPDDLNPPEDTPSLDPPWWKYK